ncbi:hypothetical protein Pla108_39300 [Botrimarina colliarenosi]|uniref:ATP synthase I chain n=1 Tax=Botrimarina colliarenosi TaxID=2528001 RepID=A0A5C6A1Z6_9BACT|nr:hypothetical protein [Botrimarina colliarenosi]TWT93436.1 hypothetical protein Pla108_39300 [Botrimarina colliarenosi]
MNVTPTDRHSLLGVAPIVVAGVVVLAVAAVLGGGKIAVVAAVGIATTLAIYVVAETIAWLSGIKRPVERMLLTMGIRGMLAAIAVVVGVTASGVEPKTVALVALPLYLSLVAGEAAVATQLQTTQLQTNKPQATGMRPAGASLPARERN